MSGRGKKQNRFNQRNRGRGGHRNQFQRNGPKKERSQAEQLKEEEVGISEYINEHPGFTGIIKARFSDFHVNEINLEGNVAKLTDTSVPHFEDEVDDGVEDRPSLVPEEVWQKIKELSECEQSEKIIELDVTTFSKDERGIVHQAIKHCFDKKIVANTITKEDKKFLEFKRFNKKTETDKRVRWPRNKPEFVHFLLYKESLDTMEACYKIADCVHIKTDNFAYAGVKDRRAKTTQWVSVKKLHPKNLTTRTRCLKNIKIGNICFKDKPLKLGELKGNRFRIALRNVTADNDVINVAMTSLKEKGFVNYYGLQRFGNDKQVPTFLIGIKLLQGNWKEACDLILKLKVSDDPNSDITEAKQTYNQTGDAQKACKLFNRNKNKCLEYKLLEGLSKNGPNDYVNALENIPRSTRLLYIHSFQSLIWNKMASRRIKELGLKPAVGDLVLIDEHLPDDVPDINIGTENGDDNNEESEVAEKGILKKVQVVKPLKEQDLKDFTIYDVVLPLPGFDIQYPENEVKEWYKDALKEYGLELEMHKQKVKTYTLSGKYRKILGKVENLSWYTLLYNNPHSTLIRSDYEEMQGDPEPVSVEDGMYKAVIIDVCLKSSNYATMMLREILKTDTSRAEQAKGNDYFEKATTSKVDNVPKSEVSLLDNPDKFALFKELVFSQNDDGKRTNEDEGDNKETKKLKTGETRT